MKIDPNTMEREWYHRGTSDSKFTLQFLLQVWYSMKKVTHLHLTQGIGPLVSVLLRMARLILVWVERTNITMIRGCLKDAKTTMLGTFNSH